MTTSPRDGAVGGRDEHPDLLALVRRELPNADALAAGDHLASCSECRGDLADLVVGASVMGRAARTLVGAPVATPSEPLPPLVLPSRRRPARDRWVLAGAAAVVAGTLGALATGLLQGGDPASQEAGGAPTPPSTSRTVPLGTTDLDTPAPAASGEVLMTTGDAATTLTFTTADLPEAAADEFYEAWLLDPATEKMLPLGVVQAGSEATFEVATSLLDQYGALDLSLEPDDGDPRHSATSVLRGTY
jgi:predicted anti-sigma-YlaC factor YlaD